MRRLCLTSVALTTLLAVVASAQESLCNPCVDPPVNRINRPGFNSTDSTVIVTAEDMRNLGVISVAEMVAQLPSNVPESPLAFSAPISLGDPDAFPPRFVSAFTAAAQHVQALEYDANEFNARIDACPESICSVDVYPVELGDANAPDVRGCPLKYCATLRYSLEESRILEVQAWRQE